VGSVHTHREALLAEALGDLDELLQRIEALQASLPAAGEQAGAKLHGAGARFLSAFEQKAGVALQGLQAAASAAHSAARVVDKAAWRFGLLAAVMGLAGGVFGGALVALVVSRGLFGG
jgi:hypothetical protein